MTPTLAFSLGPIQDLIKKLLYGIHDTVGLPWAWSIIALTVLIRLVLVPLTVKQMKSMQRMQQVAPELKKLQAKYKHDKQLMQQEVMKFYKENQVNPLGSCLPMVLQIPVMISLFFVLRAFSRKPPGGPQAVDRGDFAFLSPFIHNITLHTNKVGLAGLLLIALYVLSQLGSTLLMPTTGPASQRYMFMALPFVFVLFVYQFPVGLMLYWITTNLWTVGQTLVVRRLMPAPPTPAAPAKSEKSSRSRSNNGADKPARSAQGGGFTSLFKAPAREPEPPVKRGGGGNANKPPPTKPPSGQQRRVKRPNKPRRR